MSTNAFIFIIFSPIISSLWIKHSYLYYHRLFRHSNLIHLQSNCMIKKVLSRLETQNYCNIKLFQLLKSKWMNFVKRNVAKIVFKINRNCITNIMSHDEIGFTFYSLEPSKIWWVIQIRVRTVGLLIDINE